MNKFNNFAADMFNKIRGRFTDVEIGNENGTVTNVPEEARFFEFAYKTKGMELGKVSVSLDEENGVTVIVAKDFVNGQVESIQDDWYNFLKELRVFAKKRMLKFDVRDINKTNLDKRDYEFLAVNRTGDNMAESSMYGSNRISYQKIGSARIAIKHSAPINVESASSRRTKIGSIFIESPSGEKFKYPFKHLSGARAMALHVSEGGHAYDDFGKYISGLSEEMSKLRKFNQYVGRSTVMAETLEGYGDVVKGRIKEVKQTIANLQKPAYYKEAAENFVVPVIEDVPTDIADSWVDQLTIKQFNEELKDVFPYIYNLVGEAVKPTELGPEDLVAEAVEMCPKACCGQPVTECKCGPDCEHCDCYEKNKTTNETKVSSIDSLIEKAVDKLMGQFAESKDTCNNCGCEVGNPKEGCECEEDCHAESNVQEAYIKTSKDASDTLGILRGKGKKIERGQDDDQGNLANAYASDTWDVYNWIEARTNGFQDIDPKFKSAIDDMMTLRGEAKKLETKPGSGRNGRFGNQIVTILYPVMQYIDAHNFSQDEADDTMDVKINQKGQLAKAGTPEPEEEEQKTPIGEFILSYFDRENGTFPKGETAVLTMVEKDYGPQYVEPAAKFIEKVESMVAERKAQEAEYSRYPETEMAKQEIEPQDIKRLAGL